MGKFDAKNISREQVIAAAVTLAVVVLLLLLCFLVTLGPDFSAPKPADKENPQLVQEEEEEFLDVVLEEKGIEQADESAIDAEALPQGEPEYAETPNMNKSVSGPSEKPSKSDETLITQKPKSPVTSTPAQKNDKPDSKISSNMKNQFSPHNGVPDNSAPGAAGSGGESTGAASGSVNGRTLVGYTTPKVKLHAAVTVVVDVVVDENGNVIKATFRSGTTDASIRKACEDASRKAKWSAAKGVKSTPGTITWRLKPGTK